MQHRRRAELGADHEFCGSKQHLEVIADVTVNLFALDDLGNVIAILGLCLASHMLHDRHDLTLGDPGTLHANRLRGARREEECVTLPDQLVGTRLIQDDPAIGHAAHRECESRWHVGLDQPRHDIDAGPLRSEHQMYSGCPRQLRDAHDRIFDVSWRDHHQVGELVDDDQEVGVRLEAALAARGQHDLVRGDGTVEVVDVPISKALEVVVPHVHLFDDPAERLRGFLRIGDDRGDEVGDAGVVRQLDPLRVDQHHTHFGRRCPHEDRRDHGVDEARLAGPGGTGDQEVRHLGEIGDDESSFHVFAESDGHRVSAAGRRLGTEHVTEHDSFAIHIGDLDTDRTATGNRRKDPYVVTRHRVAEVAAERGDPLDLDAGTEFDLISGDGRPSAEPGDPGIYGELREHLGDCRHDVVVRLRPGLRR